MFDLFLFLKPQKQLFVITAEKNTKVSGIKLNTDSTFRVFSSLVALLFIPEDKWKVKYPRAGGTFYHRTSLPRGSSAVQRGAQDLGVPDVLGGSQPTAPSTHSNQSTRTGKWKTIWSKRLHLEIQRWISALKMTMSKIKAAPSSINSILWQPQHTFNVKTCSLNKTLY